MPAVSDTSLQPILAVLAYPAAANPTQFMMERAIAHHQLDCRFLTLEITPEDLGDAVRGMRAMGFAGGVCAEPHKTTVLPHLSRTTQVATLAGAVNCIYREGDDLVGANTEGQGMVDVLRRVIDPAGKRVVVLGAGKAGRAIAVELALAKVAELVIVDRTETAAAELVAVLAGKLGVPATPVAWQGHYAIPPQSDLLVNATSLGRENPQARVPLDLKSLRSEMVVADVTFNPPRTELLREAKEAGCLTVDGLEMFVRQAALALQQWTGIEPEATVMRDAVEEFLLL